MCDALHSAPQVTGKETKNRKIDFLFSKFVLYFVHDFYVSVVIRKKSYKEERVKVGKRERKRLFFTYTNYID